MIEELRLQLFLLLEFGLDFDLCLDADLEVYTDLDLGLDLDSILKLFYVCCSAIFTVKLQLDETNFHEFFFEKVD